MQPTLKIVKPSTAPQRMTKTTLDTIRITPEFVNSWELPPFQRPLRINEKVRELAEQIKQDGVVPGIFTLGILGRDMYLIDGQHRRQAFLLSGSEEAFVDVRLHHFDDMAQMGEEFVNLQSHLVKMRPDDILRGLEGTIEALKLIRAACPFIGYDMIRRSQNAPMVSMSAFLRCWFGSATEVPKASPGSAAQFAREATMEEAERLVAFGNLALAAWGRDPEYLRLWSALNLTLCMWLYRRIVLSTYSSRTTKLSAQLFTKAMMALSADATYLDWLHGRNLSERDRSPCYTRIKSIVARRLEQETGTKHLLPQPAWSLAGGKAVAARAKGKL
jgi:hypothetical protein